MASRPLLASCVVVLAAASAGPSDAAVGRAWLDARAELRSCLDKAPDLRGACLESAARAMDAAEAKGEGPLPTPAQKRRAEARDYGLRVQPVAPSPEPGEPVRKGGSRLRTTLTAARQDSSGNWIMTTAEGAVWTQTDGSYVSRPPHAGSTLEVRPAALGSFFCLINDRREVRCKRAA